MKNQPLVSVPTVSEQPLLLFSPNPSFRGWLKNENKIFIHILLDSIFPGIKLRKNHLYALNRRSSPLISLRNWSFENDEAILMSLANFQLEET
jgi:hypothetical protein